VAAGGRDLEKFLLPPICGLPAVKRHERNYNAGESLAPWQSPTPLSAVCDFPDFDRTPTQKHLLDSFLSSKTNLALLQPSSTNTLTFD